MGASDNGKRRRRDSFGDNRAGLERHLAALMTEDEWNRLLRANGAGNGSLCARPVRLTKGAVVRAMADYPFTDREFLVGIRVVFGESVLCVGQALGMSVSTVSSHLTRIYREAEVSNRTEFASEVVKRALGYVGGA